MAGLADAIVGRFTGKSGPTEEPDEDDNPESAYKTDADDDDKPGAHGKLLIKAVNSGDGEAVEECIRRIAGS